MDALLIGSHVRFRARHYYRITAVAGDMLTLVACDNCNRLDRPRAAQMRVARTSVKPLSEAEEVIAEILDALVAPPRARADAVASRAMSDVRDRLRAAATSFADSVYEILRDELLAEVRVQLKADLQRVGEGLPLGRPASEDEPATAVEKLAVRLVAWVAKHPGTTPAAMTGGLGWSRTRVFLVLAHVIETGQILKEGTGRGVRYSVAGAPAARVKTATMPPASPTTSTGGTVLDRVIAFVLERGRCRPKDIDLGISKTALYRALSEACEIGTLRKIGNRPSVEYEMAGSPSVPPTGPVTSGRSSVVDRVVAFVREHPGESVVPLAAALGVSKPTVFRAVTAAIQAGAITKVGKGQYTLVGATAPTLAERKANDVVERITAYVSKHPRLKAGKIRAALKLSEATFFHGAALAVERGLLGREGVKPQIRYVAATPGKTPLSAPSMLAGEALIEAVTAFIRANPECRYKQIVEATGGGEHALHLALRAARDRGAVRVEGVKIKTRYFPVAATPTSIAPPPAPPRGRSVPPPAPAPEPQAKPTAPSGPVLRAEPLFSELDNALAEEMHEIRLGAVLQAIVAEIRMTRPSISDDHPIARRLDGTIRRITAIRAERDLPFILGLKRDAKASWYTVAREARKRIAIFDADAEAGVAKKKTHGPPPPKRTGGAKSNGAIEIDPLPKLTALTREKAIVLVGGIKKNEVIDHVEEHHGLRVEWVAAQGANARALEHFVDRIGHGKVGAVVVLEGLTGTTQVHTIVNACKFAGVPFSYGDRAGTANLRRALGELERNVGG